ncbi:MAG: 2-amino-4-hydroxy-6-hydroxymethyldihydropteridine diphosphokinase [Pirellulaceae bacterium]
MGSNVGDRPLALRRAIELLRSHAHVTIDDISTRHETHPIGGSCGQNAFLNAAATLKTDLPPVELLHLLQETERQIGRVRHERWGARTVDLDLLLYDQQVIATPSLVVPHPRMAFRRFVLAPAVEIAADRNHPRIGWNLRQLLEHLDSAENYVAITGLADTAPWHLAKTVGNRCRARVVTTEKTGQRTHRSEVDPAGLTRETEIEFLEYCVRKLERAARRQPEWMVSDFWLGELLVRARSRLAGVDLQRYEEAWRAVDQDAISPKLTVFLDATADLPHPTGASIAESDFTRFGPLRTDLQQQVTLPGQGPFLELDASDFDGAVAEVQAAIQAMGESHD